MIRKVTLKNFMAHESTEIVLGPGLNVLVGPNNIGKSTIALALKVLARNPNSHFVMRHGAKECSVRVETSEGHELTWMRKKSPSYLINGETKDRLGRGGTPPELDETLRLAPVEFEDKDFEPHFGEQKSPIFLINRPPAQIAQFFSTTSDAERLMTMQQTHNRKKGNAASELRFVEEQHKQTSLRIDALQDVPVLENTIEDAELLRNEIESANEAIRELDTFLLQWTKWIAQCNRERVISQSLMELTPAPAMLPLDFLAVTLQSMVQGEISLRKNGDSTEAMAPLLPVPAIPDLVPFRDFLHLFETLWMSYSKGANSMTAFSELLSPPAWLEIDPLRSLADSMKQLSEAANFACQVCDASGDLSSPPILSSCQELERGIDDRLQAEQKATWIQLQRDIFDGLVTLPPAQELAALENLCESILSLERQNLAWEEVQGTAEREMSQLDTLVHTWVVEHPECPTCGSRLTAEMVRRGHSRHEGIA